MRGLLRTLATTGMAGLATPGAACDLALALAFDVSGSVNAEEYRLQVDGLAAALQDGSVSEALVRGRVAVMVMQWTGTSRQHISLPWRRIETFADVDQLALDVASIERGWRDFSTAIGEAMQLALINFDEVLYCKRRVIDISADGVSNEGVLPQDMRPALEAAAITVNGLAIESDVDGLVSYFRQSVITGPGAFVISASDYTDYPRAIRQKLLREITDQFAGLQMEDGEQR
jgi:Ca-activated chloride channel family protein